MTRRSKRWSLAAAGALLAAAAPPTMASPSRAGGLPPPPAPVSQTGSGPLATRRTLPERAPWPTFRGNPQRTGTASFHGPKHGRIVWRLGVGAPIRSSPAVARDGTVYFGSDDGTLRAVRGGLERGRIALGGRIWAGPLLADGRIFIGSDNQRFYAIGWRAGALRVVWRRKTGDFIYGSALAAGKDVVFGSWDGRIYRRRRSNGRLRWRYRAGSDVESSPTLSARGETIYAGSRDRRLHAVTRHGRRRWRYRTGDSVNSTAAVGPRGNLYFGSDDGRLISVDRRGRRRWRFDARADVLSSPALSPDGRTVYVGSHDGFLYAVSSRTGRLRWKFHSDVVWSSPAVDAGGNIYFGAWDGRIYSLSASGKVRFAVATGGPIWSSVALAPGRLYVGSNDGHLYAIE